MRGRAVVLLLFGVLLSLPLSRLRAQCNPTPHFSAPFRASQLDLAVDGNDLWTATAYGVQLFDRSADPPAPVATLAVPGTTRVVRVSGGAVWAGSGSRVYRIQRSGRTLAISSSFETGATVNDLVVTATNVYAGTAAGLLQYDRLSPGTPVTLPTSAANVTSLALLGDLLFAADGDSSVEIFSIQIPTIPQRIGTVSTLARASAVHIVAGSPTRLYTSDGFSTDAFVGSGSSFTLAKNAPFGSTAFAAIGGNVVFAAGSDRRIHAVDWSSAGAPVELFATDLIPTGGSINRVSALAAATGRVYAAGGDAGLLAWDTAAFVAPFVVRSYSGAATSSTAWADGKLYAARTAGGLSEFTQSGGSLTPARQWDSRVQTIFEGSAGTLLTATGSQLIAWTLSSATPTASSSATFPAAVTGAVLVGSKAFAVLSDKSVWSADLTQASAPTQEIAGREATAIAHSGSAVVTANVRDDGTTDLAYFATADLTATPVTANLPGASVTGVTLAGSSAALFTFNGITIHDFASGTSTVLPQSNTAVARGLVLAGSRAFELTDTSLVIWNVASRSVASTLAVPTEGLSLSIDALAGIATTTGVMTVAFDSPSRQPLPLLSANGNSYYRKVLASGDRLYLFDGRSVDVFTTTWGVAPHYSNSIRPAGVTDFTVVAGHVFTLTAGGIVGEWTRDGGPLGQASLGEGPEVQMLSIANGGEAVWVSVARGCLSGGCEKKTIVLDAATLVRTATLDGAAVDVTSTSERVYALFDLPAEVRVYSLSSDPGHPALLGSAATTGNPAPVSIDYSAGTVYVLGQKLYLYPENNLSQRTEALTAYVSPGNGVTYADQRVRIEGPCGLVIGRAFGPQWFAGQWTTATAVEVPATVRSVSRSDGRLFLLTDDSLEVWASDSGAPAARHRPTRP